MCLNIIVFPVFWSNKCSIGANLNHSLLLTGNVNLLCFTELLLAMVMDLLWLITFRKLYFWTWAQLSCTAPQILTTDNHAHPAKPDSPRQVNKHLRESFILLLIIITSACCQSVFLSDKVKHMLIMSRVSLRTMMLLHPSNSRWSSLAEEPSAPILENHPIHMLKKGRRCLFFSVPCLCLFFLLFTHLSFSLWNTLKYTDANRLNLRPCDISHYC